jgi:hypothetical protein
VRGSSAIALMSTVIGDFSQRRFKRLCERTVPRVRDDRLFPKGVESGDGHDDEPPGINRIAEDHTRNVSDLHIINELFWQFHGVLSKNARLAASNNIFFDWVNSLFSESIVMRVRREVDTGQDCVSILKMLRRLRENPAILDGKITEAELSNDIDALSGRASDIVEAAPATIVRGYADRRVAHADQRTLRDGNPTFWHVSECVGQMCVLVNKYARVASDEELSALPPACGTGWKEVLTFPWIDQ